MAREPASGSGTTAAPAQLYRSGRSMASGVCRCEPGSIGRDRSREPRAKSAEPPVGFQRLGRVAYVCPRGGEGSEHTWQGVLSLSFRYRLYANALSAVNRMTITIANAAQNLILHVPVSYSPFAAAKATGLSGAAVSNSVLCIRCSQDKPMGRESYSRDPTIRRLVSQNFPAVHPRRIEGR